MKSNAKVRFIICSNGFLSVHALTWKQLWKQNATKIICHHEQLVCTHQVSLFGKWWNWI